MSIGNIISGKLKPEKHKDLLLAFKEILNNVRKHAGAKKVIIELKTDKNHLFLKVKDDGQGFTTDLLTDRNGLKKY